MDVLQSLLNWLVVNSEWISPISNLAVLISAIFVGIQAKLFFDDYRKRNRKEEFENSFRLTNYYIKNIIPKFQVIYSVFRNLSLDKKIGKKLKNVNLEYFDKEERNEIFEEFTFSALKSEIDKAKIDLLIDAMAPYLHNDPGESLEHYYRFISLCKHESTSSNEIYRQILLNKFWGVIVDVQNDMEYFAMYFNSHLAESDVIYDSMHQTFTDYVKMLYPFISEHNARAEHSRKFFTNTKRLYIDWISKDAKVKTDAKKAVDGIVNEASKNKKI